MCFALVIGLLLVATPTAAAKGWLRASGHVSGGAARLAKPPVPDFRSALGSCLDYSPIVNIPPQPPGVTYQVFRKTDPNRLPLVIGTDGKFVPFGPPYTGRTATSTYAEALSNVATGLNKTVMKITAKAGRWTAESDLVHCLKLGRPYVPYPNGR
jgi:hypothetical protein